VIARNTAFAYKGKPLDVKTIGRELNVCYVLEGSVQRSGGRMRVNVQLIDAETGSHLWAERFDKPVAYLLDMQDEIVARPGKPASGRAHQCRGATRGTGPEPRLDGPLLSACGLVL
jgi:TolB-like protein